MSEKSTTRCPTPRCIDSIEKWGDNYHAVYEKGAKERYGENAVLWCERCGGWFDGTTWHHECAECKIEVSPGELVGLFVPHLCRDCERKTAEREARNGNVCLMCHQPYSRCCC